MFLLTFLASLSWIEWIEILPVYAAIGGLVYQGLKAHWTPNSDDNWTYAGLWPLTAIIMVLIVVPIVGAQHSATWLGKRWSAWQDARNTRRWERENEAKMAAPLPKATAKRH